MNIEQAKIGTWVRALRHFAGVPAGSIGIIDEDYGSGVMVAWDLPGRNLPKDYVSWTGRRAAVPGVLRDGFDKETELEFLEVAAGWERQNKEALDGLANFNAAFRRHFG